MLDVDSQHNEQHKDMAHNKAVFDKCFPLARAYVPFQKAKALYSPEDGLRHGTAFPELDAAYTWTNKSRFWPNPNY